MYEAGLSPKMSSWVICVNGNPPRRLFPFLVHKNGPFISQTGGRYIRYRRKACRIRTRKRYFIKVGGKRKPVRRVFRRIGLYWKKRYRKVIVRRGRWRVRIKRRICRIKRRGRKWYYRRRGRKWRKLSRPRFVIRFKRKRRRLIRRYGGWRFRVKKRWTRLIGRVRRFIRVRGRRRWLKRRGRKYAVRKRNGRLSRPKKVRRFFGLISEYNISCSTKRFALS